MINVDSTIKLAEQCSLALAKIRVTDVTFGNDEDDSLYSVFAINGMIEALEKYKCGESCLCDEEICVIIERVNKICQNCDCNCN